MTSEAEQGWAFSLFEGVEQATGTPLLLQWMSDRATPQEAERRLRQGKAAMRIASPRIARVLSAEEPSAGQVLVVMERIEGTPLADLGAALPVARLLALGLELSELACTAHEAGLVIRSLNDRAVFARPSPGASGAEALSAYLPCGQTAWDRWSAFLAPELRLGGKADSRVDLWSMGVVLYKLLTAPTERKAAFRLPERDGRLLPPSRAARRSLPRGLDDLILACLERDPAARLQSSGELRAWLLRLGAPGQASASPPGRPVRERVDWSAVIANGEARLARGDKREGDAAEPCADQWRSAMLRFEVAHGYQRRGVESFELGDTEGALRDFERALAKDQAARYHHCRAVALQTRGEHEPAIEAFCEALRLTDAEVKETDRWGMEAEGADRQQVKADALFGRGVSLSAGAEHEGAVRDFTRALRLGEQAEESRSALAAEAGLALERRPWQARSPVLHARAVSRHALGDFEGAVADDTEALLARPRDTRLLWSRAISLYALGHYRQALADCDAMVTLEPDEPQHRRSRALVHDARGDRAAAKRDREAASAALPAARTKVTGGR